MECMLDLFKVSFVIFIWALNSLLFATISIIPKLLYHTKQSTTSLQSKLN